MITEPLSWGNSYRYFLAHLIGMPGWHKAVVLIAALVCGSGTFGSIASRPATTSTPAAVATTAPSDTGSAWGNTIMSRVSPHMIKVGASIVLGFVIGWYLRAFIRTMVLLGIIVIGCTWLAAHFNLLHMSQGDVDTVRQRGMEATHWVEANVGTWKDWLVAKLPSAGGGTLGAWLGFQRK